MNEKQNKKEKYKKNKKISNKIYILLIIINLITFYLFIGSYYTYKDRNEIMISQEPIENYEITEYRCNMKGGSVLEITYKMKRYKVAIAYNYCYPLKKDKMQVDFFYDKNSDKVFTSSGLTKKMVITFGIIFLIFISFWLIPKRYW